MIIRLFRYIKGYVVVNFSGEFSEQILNIAAKNSIKLWSLRCSKRSIIGSISVSDFRKLRSIRKNTGIRIKIMQKSGLPFIIRKYKRRAGFLIGFLIFMVFLKLMSMFIWTVEVEGNKAINENIIIDACEELGIRSGILSSKIKPQMDAQKLLLKQSGLSWASLNIEGCMLTVNVTEIVKNEKEDFPSNLKASLDGIIKHIEVTSGEVLVKNEDIVHKGDVIVSGIIERLESTVFVRSAGKIIAETERTISESGKYKTNLTKENGQVKYKTAAEVFGLKIPLFLGTTKEKYNVSTNRKTLKIFDRELPISFTTNSYYMTDNISIVYTKEELQKILKEKIDSKISKMPLESYEEVLSEVIETEDGLILRKTFKCRENIVSEEEILIGNIN